MSKTNPDPAVSKERLGNYGPQGGCEVRDGRGKVCGKQFVATWRWPGGPGLKMCLTHDGVMKQHVKVCKGCSSRLER